ncbi:zinc-ribbon domain-containing protein [Bacillus xiapuensis]|uniref:Zinc-ribbon domain-containing protein n=1 Tax=Bacillus xiapuensis TaxID=2014075 RepID=A0ABU6N8Q9_9BACI|nr:zinc-ribbon domain-containing protein [Bacillus xiapuensis]
MIIDQKVKAKWTRRTRKHYESKGYLYTGNEDEFFINVNDLSEGSHTLVKYTCDYCLGENQKEEKDKWKVYKDLLKQRKTTNKDCCGSMECKSKKLNETYINNLIESKETLGHKFPNLVLEWHPKNEKSPFQYSYGSEYKVWWICEKGHEWEDSALHRTGSNRGCPYCSGRKVCIDNCLQTIRPDISREWHPFKNGDSTPFDVTCGSDKKIWWICRFGHEFYSSIVNRTTGGNGCSICKESKGEKKIRLFLDKNNINFKPQYEFNGLVGLGGKNLKFDFAIFKDSKLELVIEYDGEFHFNKYYDDDGYEKIVEHDKRKNQYCIENHIPLLRIPYWEFNNIEEILQKELAKYDLND